MASEVVMPKLGATMEEGTIVTWLVQLGEIVEEGDPIAEVQTDKIVMEIEAESTGVLLKTMFEEGDVVRVHEIIAYLGEEGESLGDVSLESSIHVEQQISAATEVEISVTPKGNEKIRRTPAARKLAEDNQINLHAVTGTGPLGRIQRNDVENYLRTHAQKITPLAKKIAVHENINYSDIKGSGQNGKITKEDLLTRTTSVQEQGVDSTPVNATIDKRVPFKGIRKVIADRMAQSAYTAPHVTLNSEVDMTNCVKVRKDLLPSIEKINGHRLSFNEIIVKAAAVALKNHPDINISLQGDEIVYHSSVNIGFAVAVPNGLVVPVVKNADTLGLAAITDKCKTVGKQARDGKLLPEHMKGGTFTISNLGMYAVDTFSPIINQPEAAILGVGRIVEKPVVFQKEITIRSMMSLSLSFDHRIIDGAPAAAFLTELKDILENPYKLMI